MIVGWFSGCAPKSAELTHNVTCKEGIYSMKSAQCIDRTKLLDQLEAYPVLFIGDHHTSDEVHQFTADLITSLAGRGYRVHLANEWFSSEDDLLLAAYAGREIDDGNFTSKVGWKQKAGYDFESFAPIYHAVREADGHLYGINLSKPFQRAISEGNTTAMDLNEFRFHRDLDMNVSVHNQFFAPFFSHCHAPKPDESEAACILRMKKVQVAWDTMMGRESARLAEEHLKDDKEKLIVFVGSMHLIHHLGVNLRFSRYSDLPGTTLIPHVPAEGALEHGMADYLYLYTPTAKPLPAE
jgi:uncharacterized iron-regulated protein